MPSPKKTSRQKDGLDSRDRLLEAAIDIFGQHGFDAATTRMIAAEAGANLAAIPYYFGSKTGLYQTVVEHIAAIIESQIHEGIRSIEKRIAESAIDTEEAVEYLEKLLGGMIDFMVGSTEAPRFARIILREQLYPTPAYDIILNRVLAPFLRAIAQMTAVITGEPVDGQASLRALAIMGQVMAFRIARETAVRALGMKGYTREETANISRMILEQTRAALTGLGKTEGYEARRRKNG